MPTHQTNTAARTPGAEPIRLRLSSRERNGLVWLRLWSRQTLTRLKVRRKYRPHQPVMDPAEVDLLSALVQLEQAAGRLLAEDEETPVGAGEVA